VRAYLLLLVAIPVAFAAIALAQSVVTMVLLVTLSGAVLAPLTIAENQVLQRIAPPGAITEAFTWVLMASILGLGAGSAVGGTLVDSSGWRVAMLAGAATAAVGALVAFARRRTLAG
jgi:predicted MFS family arabinose efflux permease